MSIWLKQSMKTHFAGGDIPYRKNVNEISFNRTVKAIKECLDEVIECPICTNDTFSDGVYHNRLTKEGYVKLIGIWYKYNTHGMFEYYQMANAVAEMDTKDHNAILEISKTKYATKLQREFVNHIKNFYDYKIMRKNSMIKIKKLEEINK